MGIDWQAEAEAGYAARITKPGDYLCKIVRLVWTNKEGQQLYTAHGDPQVMICAENNEREEACFRVTLSERAAWVLARLLGYCDPPLDLQRMTADGAELEWFLNEEWANGLLIGRWVWLRGELSTAYDGNPRMDWLPLKKQAKASPTIPPRVAQRNPLGASAPTAPAGGAVQTPPAPATSPPTIAPAAPPSAPPPPSTPAPAAPKFVVDHVNDKQTAWELVLQEHQPVLEAGGMSEKDLYKKWNENFACFGKAENEFTADDWRKLASETCIPF